MARFLLLDDNSTFPTDSHHRPLLVTHIVGDLLGHAVHVVGDIYAVRAPAEVVRHVSAHGTSTAREHARNRMVARAVALLANRERNLFDPRDGSPVTFDDAGFVSRGARDRPIFPRLDPAVIGVVVDKHKDAILLGENRHRRGFYSCIAGYVEHGENLEEAFAREVLEETGYTCTNIRYAGSQPWAPSGSLMVGFYAELVDEPQAPETDGELAHILWATRDDLEKLPLPAEGSLAHTLISGSWHGESATRKDA